MITFQAFNSEVFNIPLTARSSIFHLIIFERKIMLAIGE